MITVLGLVVFLPLGGYLGDMLGAYFVSKRYAMFDSFIGTGVTAHQRDDSMHQPENHKSRTAAEDRGMQVVMMAGLVWSIAVMVPAFAMICTRTVIGAVLGQVKLIHSFISTLTYRLD